VRDGAPTEVDVTLSSAPLPAAADDPLATD
jgi:hypothetical protein